MASSANKHVLGTSAASLCGVHYKPDSVLSSTKRQDVLGCIENHMLLCCSSTRIT